jgi:hypothetical protein
VLFRGRAAIGEALLSPAKRREPVEREKGSETGFHKGRSITRDAVISAGFANPSPTAGDTK